MTGHQRRRLTIAVAAVITAAVVIGKIVLSTDSRSPGHRALTTTTPTTRSVPSSSTTTSSVTAAAPAPAMPAPTGQRFGANVNLLFNLPGLAGSLIATQLRALRAVGATVARSDALWEASEPRPPAAGVHRYDWTFDDRIAGALAAAGLRWLPILDYSAPWAQSIPGQDHSPPRAVADYAAYARAFAERYGAGGTFWRAHPGLAATPVDTIEVWNEPDNGQFWTPTPDAAAYAALYAAARLSIDAADPAARVIIGGLTRPTEFLPAMLAARPSLAGHIDGVAVHPYGTPPVVAAKLAADRAMLLAAGLAGVPLYATEFGWTTSPPGALDYVPAVTRPSYIRRTLEALSTRQCGVSEAVLYTWYSAQSSPADSQQWYGVSDPTGRPSPDTSAFALGLHDAATGSARGRPCG